MKKLIAISTLILSLFSSTTVFASSTIPVYFEGEPIKLSQKPLIKNGTSLVPFRGIFETLGFDVSWDNDTSTISGFNDDTTISLQLGSTTAYINDEPKKLSVAPQLIKGSTMVPLRFISESAGHNVEWNNDNQYILIGENDMDLVNVYEDTNTFTMQNMKTKINLPDLYNVAGTGKYSGYKRLLGHGFSNFDIYYTYSDGKVWDVKVIDKNYNPNEIVYGKFGDHSFSFYRKDVYELLDDNNYYVTKARFGSVVTDWNNHSKMNRDAPRLIDAYYDYTTGARFDAKYKEYKDKKAKEAKRAAEEEERLKELAIQEEKKRIEEELFFQKFMETYEDTSDIEKQYRNEWITKSELKKKYNITATWEGDTIPFTVYNDVVFTIYGSPRGNMGENIIREGNGVRYQYAKTIEYPFPEAKDGSGVHSIEVRDLIFSREDLIRAGVIK